MSRQPKRTDNLKRRSKSRRLSIEALECRELLTGFTVMTAQDNGDNTNPTPGSLRAAIIAADGDNTTIGGYPIMFAIPGGASQPIALQSPLPPITRQVAIDGAMQSNSSITPGVTIDGSGAGAGANGLTFSGGAGSFVTGLAIVGFTATGAGAGGNAILVDGTASNTTIDGDYIGIEADGATAKGNSNGVVVTTAANTIGGTTAATRDVISNSTFSGVLIIGSGATNNVVIGDYIGTGVSGTGAAGNLAGVVLESTNNVVGGTVAGSANVISGNTGPTGQTGIGVLFEGPAMTNIVEGNKIGTDVTGLVAVPNVYGVYFGTPPVGSTADTITQETIGGTVAGTGNLISGNDIGITGNTTKTLIAGNTIGLDNTGTKTLPNSFGILLGATASTIGGTTAAARNVISGAFVIPNGSTPFGGTGIDLTGDTDLIEGNYIGLTAAGVGGTGTGNVVGLALHTTNTTVAGNFIAGNSGDAIALDGLSVNATLGDSPLGGNVIQGNFIGEAVNNAALPNGGNGINLTIAAPSTTPTTPLALNDSIGGTTAGSGNIIANSGGAGIVVHDNYPTGITGLDIRSNTIFANAKLGIDLNGSGVPIPSTLFVTSTGTVNGLLSVAGVIFGAPSASYAIDLFANGADPSGFGQGPIFLGTQTVTTNSSGFAVFNPSFGLPSTPYTSYSATATGPDGSTTEFSANFPAVLSGSRADLSVTNSASSSTIVVDNSVTLTETVTNNGPNAANGVLLTDSLPTSLVNVQVQSSPGSASVDSNNVVTAVLGMLAPGQSATVTIVGVASQQGSLVDAPGASSTTFDPNYANNQAVQTITVTPSGGRPVADLAISQVASPTSGTVGSNLTYIVTVTNNGPNTSTNATVNDFLPAGVTLVSATTSPGAPAVVNGTLVTSNLGTIASGATATLTLVVTPTAAGSITNAANVSGNQFDPVPPANNSTSLTTVVVAATPKIDLILAQSAFPSTGRVGQYQIFTMTVTNFGPDPATNVTLIDSLPANVTFVNAAPSQGGFASLVNGVLTENFGTIAARASATLTLVVTPNGYGLFTNFAGVYSPDVPSAPASFAFGAVSVPSGPSVVGVAGSGSNRQLAVFFDEALNSRTATNRANYKLTALGKAGKGPNKSIAISSVAYNAATNSVLITPSQALDPTQYYQLVVVGSTSSGISDTLGRRLVNPQYSSPGANFTATFFAGTLAQV